MMGYVRFIELGIGWSQLHDESRRISDGAGHDEGVSHLFNS
ncbi:hypothetical protein [Bacillus paralicheniformis]